MKKVCYLRKIRNAPIVGFKMISLVRCNDED